MANILAIFGECLLILALLGLIGVLVWVILTVIHVKNTTVGHAKRLSERPIKATKNLVATVKGIGQQEMVRVKHIGASAKTAIHAVQGTVSDIKGAAESVHPEELKPALAGLKNVTKILGFAAHFTQSAAKQKAR